MNTRRAERAVLIISIAPLGVFISVNAKVAESVFRFLSKRLTEGIPEKLLR